MHPEDIKLKILGAPSSIDARALHRSLGGLLDLLSGATSAHWVIADLKVGSAEVDLKPAADAELNVDEVFREIVAGLVHLEHESSTPADWGDAMMEALVDIGSVTKFPGVEGVEISCGGHGIVRLDSEVVKNAARALSTPHRSLGSVKGTIDRYISRSGRKNFGLLDESTGKSVKVTFPSNMESRVVESIGKEVLAWGELRRDQRGRKVSLRLDDFELVERSEGPVSTQQIVGILGVDWTGGLGSVNWVRGQRDG